MCFPIHMCYDDKREEMKVLLPSAEIVSLEKSILDVYGASVDIDRACLVIRNERKMERRKTARTAVSFRCTSDDSEYLSILLFSPVPLFGSLYSKHVWVCDCQAFDINIPIKRFAVVLLENYYYGSMH